MSTKKAAILIIITLLIGKDSFSQNYSKFIVQSDSLYKIKAYSKAFELSKHAFGLGDTNYGDLYNGARLAALTRKPDEAFYWLNISYTYRIPNTDYQFGQKDIDSLKIDSSLINLHTDKRWVTLINKLQKNNDSIEANFEQPLTSELDKINENWLSIYHINDIGYNRTRPDSLSKIRRFDDTVVTHILDTKGWLGRDKVGVNGNAALFRVMCTADLKTQEKYTPMMLKALKKKTLQASQYAIIQDELALREGKKQIYGTIYHNDTNTNGFYISRLEDPDNVDKRRESIGLSPMAIYTNQNLGFIWNVEEYKKKLPQIEWWDDRFYPSLITN